MTDQLNFSKLNLCSSFVYKRPAPHNNTAALTITQGNSVIGKLDKNNAKEPVKKKAIPAPWKN
jgi:hypothetical protein